MGELSELVNKSNEILQKYHKRVLDIKLHEIQKNNYFLY